MRSLLVGVLCITVAGLSLAQDKEGKKNKKAAGPQTTVSVTGKVICAHCELGIGESCNTGIKANDTGFVLEGQAAQDLFEKRKDNQVKQVSGTLSAKNGVLYVNAKKASDPKDEKAAKEATRLSGTLEKDGDKLVIKNGESKIVVTGKGVAKLGDDAIGKRVNLNGKITADKENNITIDAKSAKVAEEKKKDKA